ncbi:hypothetical protein STEG23_035642 [Scotinomys teguina]
MPMVAFLAPKVHCIRPMRFTNAVSKMPGIVLVLSVVQLRLCTENSVQQNTHNWQCDGFGSIVSSEDDDDLIEPNAMDLDGSKSTGHQVIDAQTMTHDL